MKNNCIVMESLSPEVNICSQDSIEVVENLLKNEPLVSRILKINYITKINHIVSTKDMFKAVTKHQKLNELQIAL